jgi:hypothetical protein
MGPRPLFPPPTKSWERKPSRSHQTLTPTKFVGVASKAKVLQIDFSLLSRSCHKKEGLPPATLWACCLPMARRRHPGTAGVLLGAQASSPGTAGVLACM